MPVVKNNFYMHYIFSGSYRQVGEEHGEALRDAIQNHLQIIYDLSFRTSGLQKNDALKTADAFAPFIQKYNLGFYEELQGLAAGANISFTEALLLQVRQEVVNLGRFAIEEPECTSFAVSPEYTVNKKMYAGQNADLSGDFESITNVITFAVNGRPQIMMPVPAGQISYQGMNSEGIGANANMVRSKDWKKGFPRYLLTRLALEQPTLQKACQALDGVTECAAGRNILLSDYTGAIVDYEITPCARAATHAEGYYVHANHFIAPKMISYEIGNAAELKNSMCRFDRLTQLIVENKGKIDRHMIRSFLRDHVNGDDSICMHAVPHHPYHTFSSMISNLTDRVMEVAKGNPCETEYVTYEFTPNV